MDVNFLRQDIRIKLVERVVGLSGELKDLFLSPPSNSWHSQPILKAAIKTEEEKVVIVRWSDGKNEWVEDKPRDQRLSDLALKLRVRSDVAFKRGEMERCSAFTWAADMLEEILK